MIMVLLLEYTDEGVDEGNMNVVVGMNPLRYLSGPRERILEASLQHSNVESVARS
jgi:hypothetical protein